MVECYWQCSECTHCYYRSHYLVHEQLIQQFRLFRILSELLLVWVAQLVAVFFTWRGHDLQQIQCSESIFVT